VWNGEELREVFEIKTAPGRRSIPRLGSFSRMRVLQQPDFDLASAVARTFALLP